MFDRLRAWWTWGQDPRQPLPAETARRLEQLDQQWHAVIAVARAHLRHRLAVSVPWYLVVGPTGAGKSTLLANAGLGLDAVSSNAAEAVTAADGVTFWFNEQAVFIEVAGRHFSDPTAHREWQALLWLIRRAHGHLPLSGVIIVKPLAEQLRRTPTEAAIDAKLTRDRLHAVADITGTVVPTYVVITKADLLGGFKEFFASSERTDSEHVLGMTMAWPPDRDPVQGITVEYERLLDSVRDHRITALGATTNESAQRKLIQFPGQMRAALPFLTDYLAIVARPRQEAQPTLRGLYLTSILPAPRQPLPVVPPGGEELEYPKSITFDVPTKAAPGTVRMPAEPALAPVVDNRPITRFVAALFSRILLPDAALVTLTPQAKRHWHVLRMSCLGVVPLLLLVVILWTGWSAWRGVRLVDDLRQPYVALSSNTTDMTAQLLALDQLGRALGAALEHHGKDLGQTGISVAQRYVGTLRPLLLNSCLVGVREELAALRQPTASQHATKNGTADLLRAYQMLGGMVEPQNALIVRALLNERRWFRAVDPAGGGTCEFRIEALARQQLDLCVETLLPAGLLRIDIDRPLVTALHQELGDRLLVDQAYEELLQRLTPKFAVVAPESLLSEPQHNALGAATNVSLLYSQEAWDATVARAIDDQADTLVDSLAELNLPHDRATIIGRLRQRFVDDHQQRWLAVIASMRAAHVRDSRDTAAQIERLCGEDSPVPRFITSTLAHLALTVADTTTRGKTDSTWVRPCLQAIGSLRSDVLDYQQAMTLAKRTIDVDRLRVLIGRFNAVSARIGGHIAHVEPPTTRTAIQTGFDTLLRSLVADLDRTYADDLDRMWSEQIYQTFAAHLASRFPFTRDASEDLPMIEFESFFQPNGTLWSVLTQLETMRDISVLGRPAVTLSNDYHRVLRTAQSIRSLFFVGSSTALNLRFNYRMQQREHVRDLRVQFGASTNTLYERPDARYLAEIVHGSPYGARISLQTVNGEWKHHEQAGDWGFVRLLRAGQPKLGAGGDHVCTWEHEVQIAGKAQGVKATLILEAGGMAEAVSGDLLSGLMLPRRIVKLDASR